MRPNHTTVALWGGISLIVGAALALADEPGTSDAARRADDVRWREVRDAVETPTRYSMTLKTLRVDDCAGVCPGLFGAEPTRAPSLELLVAQVERGRLGGVLDVAGGTPLDGARFALLAESRGPTHGTDRYTAYAVYVDIAAAPEQRDALRRILGAAPFSRLGTLLGYDEVPITIFEGEGPFGEWKANVGALGGVNIEPRGGATGKRVSVVNPAYILPVDAVVLGKAFGTFEDHGRRLALKSSGGELAEITVTGELPARAAPAGVKSEPSPGR